MADGLVKLGHAHGGFLEGLTLYSPEFQTGPHKLVGRAFTVKFVAKSDTTSAALEKHYVGCTAVIGLHTPLKGFFMLGSILITVAFSFRSIAFPKTP